MATTVTRPVVPPVTPADCPQCGDPWTAGKTFCTSCGYNPQTAAAIENLRQDNERELESIKNLLNTPGQHLYSLNYNRNGLNSNPWKWGKRLLLIVGLVIVWYVIMLGLNADSLITTMFMGINTSAFIGGTIIALLLAIVTFVSFRNRL